MLTTASVFTPSHNKRGYAAEAIRSVLAQEFTDFEYWILENSTDGGATREVIAPLLGDPRIVYEEIDLTPEERAGSYPAALVLNRYYPKASGDIIFYLSDDDLLEPDCLRKCVAFMGDGVDVCWFSQAQRNEHGNPAGYIGATHPAGAGTFHPGVDCRIDGGQVVHRRSCLDVIGHPYFDENPDPSVACHADGLFLQRLADVFTFHPLNETLGVKRCLPSSTWWRG
jgi:glycosyltransferase involved in cell wall biosynthesis